MKKWTRRAFIATGGLAGAGLLVGTTGLLYLNNRIRKYSGWGLGPGTSMNAWVRIAPDNIITLAIPRVEMGQGVHTSLPMLIAEELEVNMDQLNIVTPQPESPYTNLFLVTQQPPDILHEYTFMQKFFSYLTLVVTGGSSSVSDAYNNLRYAGASAREMLKTAAAKRWQTSIDHCLAKEGIIINTQTNEQVAYGELATEAALINLGGPPALKPRKNWRLLSKEIPRLDIPAKVSGKAIYSLDVRLDNQLYAVFYNPKIIGSKIVAIDNEAEVVAMPGIKKALFTQYGIAIIATNTWYAKKAIEKLQLKTADEHNGSFNSAQIAEQMAAALEVGPTIITEEVGEVDPIFADHTDLMEATYKAPFLAHAPMETVSCTALVTRDGVDIWVGHQSISGVQSAASHITGIAKENIRIHTTFLGGGFGRKGELAIVLRACTVAKAFPGIPVMTLYTREEDMQCSIYRPGSVSKFKAAIGSGGEILAWENHVVAQAPMIGGMSRAVPPMDPMPGMENGVGDGAHFLPYYMAHRKVGLTIPDLPIEVGLLRSVCNGLNAYFTECFLDECAHKAHQDPLQ
ncbi:MAG: molybdopterin cofactor-binding domain-containing protein, partial [Bacteroidota bacterium]